jgi:hypothetical protein
MSIRTSKAPPFFSGITRYSPGIKRKWPLPMVLISTASAIIASNEFIPLIKSRIHMARVGRSRSASLTARARGVTAEL